ncbi:hypothetical protein B7494_g7542 [Chlorociboria aeruginascens]|nr:hypothetical protein B7494_g7542 [Chlorociboria aeruginascens]
MATTRKRNASDKVDDAKTQFEDTDSEDAYKEDDDELSEDENLQADTPATPLSPAPKKKFPSQLKTIKCTYEGCPKTFNRPARYEGCDKSYLQDKHLAAHVKAAHTSDRPHVCEHEGCGKSFTTATKLRRHNDTHENHNRFRCTAYPPCNQSFRKHQTLLRHIRSDHLELAPYPCTVIDLETMEVCQAGYDGPHGLRRHIESVHGIQSFLCDRCTGPGKIDANGLPPKLGFTTQNKLDAHIKKVHVNCPFCDQSFFNRPTLQAHVEGQHSGTTLEERKNVPCTFPGCNKTFTKKANLKTHVRSAHNGERFTCGVFDVRKTRDISHFDNKDGCGLEYTNKATLEDHIRTKHLSLPTAIKRKKPLASRSTSPVISECEKYLGNPDDDFNPSKPKVSKKKKPTAIDGLVGIDPRRSIRCTFETCTQRFIREYDLHLHIQSKHRLSTPEIDELVSETMAEFNSTYLDPPELGYNYPDPGAMHEELDIGYGPEIGQEDDLPADLDWESLQQRAEGGLPFWIGADEETQGDEDWTREELEMRRLIGGDY